MSFSNLLSNFTLFQVITTVLGLIITGIFSYMFHRVNAVVKVVNYELANGVPHPPPRPTRLPVRRYREHIRSNGIDHVGLIATVHGLREFSYDVQKEVTDLKTDVDLILRGMRESSDQINEIDEKLDEFRWWMKKTQEVLESQQGEIRELQERYRQHDADLEHIAFTPRKQNVVSRSIRDDRRRRCNKRTCDKT